MTTITRGIVVLSALTLLSVPVFAASPASSEECDPETDLWNCECPEDLEAVACHEVPYSELPDFSDLGQVDVSDWIDTIYDSEAEVYRVTVDLDAMPGRGVFKALARDGHWESEVELHQYLSTLLSVPIDEETGRLEEFEYRQIGQSRKYVLLEGFLASSGVFWKDLVTDGTANTLHIDGEPVGLFPVQCTPNSYVDLCDADGNGAPCRSEVPLVDGRLSALSVNEVHTWQNNATGFGCARNFLGDLLWDMSLYVVENATQEQAQNTKPFHCEIEAWPGEVQCNLVSTEELTHSEAILDPNDTAEVALKRGFRIVRARAKIITETEYFRNDKPLNQNRLSVNEAFSVEIDYGRQFLNGMCTDNAISLGSAMDMAENGTAHQSVATPECLP